MPKISLIVTFNLPDGVSPSDAREYVRDAVGGWGGQMEPPNTDNDYTGDPRFGMGRDVTVKYMKMERSS